VQTIFDRKKTAARFHEVLGFGEGVLSGALEAAGFTGDGTSDLLGDIFGAIGDLLLCGKVKLENEAHRLSEIHWRLLISNSRIGGICGPSAP
jgi:hypothetical protein